MIKEPEFFYPSASALLAQEANSLNWVDSTNA
jgi:hypothetical protein